MSQVWCSCFLLFVLLVFGLVWVVVFLLILLLLVFVEVSWVLCLDIQCLWIGFEVWICFGQCIEGVFLYFEGCIEILFDGCYQVYLKMFICLVEIFGKVCYIGWMCGEEFFDVGCYLVVEFDLLLYWLEMVEQGGDINGWLILCGVSYFELLWVEKVECV